ncbi:S-layer homology domain-containing protein [Succiniclasticum ruminis]|uniref:S-layer homology domain-containing protein n=1 Tax=Succiniclasticum ruminis TaxID=40841 RepID=A0A1G6IX26_9FIRM|nr:S-layer homology domain-containing protein [Succiniclasticum ruminis]SDC10326.1 S-layer homology domain-containing protein [Succiniclasticum ruminis]
MKKSLVLAMAMALGVTASAYAANPFSDVPAGHWAYDSISKLAAAGVIEGYGDDTFRGDRLMTRYEMAQIVAKAMAKGANVDKLAAEFADELDALGVRVAALEKKSDNVKITGTFRWEYQRRNFDTKAPFKKEDPHKLRSRITFTGKVNDSWNYVGMLENDHEIGKGSPAGEGTNFQRAYLDGRLGGLKTQAGRINKSRLSGGDLYSTRMDGVDFTYGDKVRLNAFYGKPTNAKIEFGQLEWKHYWGVNAAADLGKNVTLFAGYDQIKAKDVEKDTDKIFDVGLNFKFAKAAYFDATYLHASYDAAANDAPKNGFILGLGYGGAKGNKVGSWGIAAKYYHVPAGGFIAPGYEWIDNPYDGDMYTRGAKGWWAGAKYTVAKNMIFDVEYMELKARGEGDKVKNKTWLTSLTVSF